MDVRAPEDGSPLRPGDILLFHGLGFVSWAIRRFDESDVDRVAIVVGPGAMVEATASGLRQVAIEPAVDGSAFTYVRRLTSGAAPSSVAEQALGFSTALPPTDDPTVLLAVLAMTRRLPIGEPTLRRLLCSVLDRATGVVERLRGRGRSLLLGSEFVYRCFERANDPRATIDVRLASDDGYGPHSLPSTVASRTEATLWEWASHIPDPKGRTAKTPEEPLEPLIAAFSRVDSPNDPIVPRSSVADPATAEPTGTEGYAQLHAASVRFRDAMLRSVRTVASTTGSPPEDPWERFRRVSSFVTPGDLRYSHSLLTVTSLRPSAHPSTPSGGRVRARHKADR